MITTTTLYTVRHGLSENNIEQGRKILLPGLIQTVSKALGSNAAVLLTELLDQVIREKSSKYPLADRNVALGKERFAQAYLTGEKLSNLDINPEIILASTYLRAKQTAGEIQNGYQTATKRRVPITYHEFLTERYVGDHFGYPFDYYKYLFPESYLQYLKEGELIYRPPNGESKQDVWDRIKGNLERTLMPFSGKVILIVGHECVNLCIHSVLTGTDFGKLLAADVKIPNLGIYGYTNNENTGWEEILGFNGKMIL
ncbi:hypothetical protein A2276_01660 [candidate division WOR-1 bacterium RIFOXYA12_FULL_43_27]|uniref:Phosphoglycerate mutase n=1 Tax=candidate division WOR-1 bacterium RIFOXYC2_FULL_46_14 TaxID=1802587 RepID=A0A1F4U8K7_UNCSA|nr:MAG: hypothetical protein A2276_01660 [candidate division WOR-1 bacterium RIFOXYA12_FULL_43_27]OGC19568.1 MAG: hypothetical protein A2292_02670 [candidate division WOR-1 bacterium RIFOXYB2_FULL_46_45]OGC30556.1 MAG: hypothetical protein A2232_02670 [candidate division WOR-1 bacterium RIFOXYA2_FULL_46_56]OGC40623.1 MAG: hypothetical protein A2438_06385 [candidate division WOR-1 bacterium RIFOXYC2_FULL_46_14]